MCAFAAAGCVVAIAQMLPSGDWQQGPAVLFAFVVLFAVLCALLFALASTVALRRHPSPLPAGRLVVDAAGNAGWRPLAGDPAVLEPVTVERWCVIGSFAWVALRFAGDGRARDLLVLQGGDEPAWRGLRAWLVWYGRGRTTRSVPAAGV